MDLNYKTSTGFSRRISEPSTVEYVPTFTIYLPTFTININQSYKYIYPWILWVGWKFYTIPIPAPSTAPFPYVLRLGGLSLCIVEVCRHCNHSLTHVTWSSGNEIFGSVRGGGGLVEKFLEGTRGIPSRELTYPHLGKRKHHLQTWFLMGYVNSLEGNRFVGFVEFFLVGKNL